MMKWFLAVGLILITSGLILTGNYRYSSEAVTSISVANTSQTWGLTANLTKDDKIVVLIYQGGDWPVGLFDPEEETQLPLLYVGINITDPRGNLTLFLIRYIKSYERFPLSIMDINITVNEGGLDASSLYKPNTNSYWDVGGVVQFNGTYSFSVSHVYPHRDEPPSKIDVRKGIVVTEYPFTNYLPIGVIVTTAGVTLSWFSLRDRTKLKSRKKRGKTPLRYTQKLQNTKILGKDLRTSLGSNSSYSPRVPIIIFCFYSKKR